MSMMQKICLLLFVKVLSESFGYEGTCPASSEWRLRARAMNCTGKFVCLQRLPEYDHVEKCNGPNLSNKGTKLVFQPHFNNAKCIGNRYQPFRFSTEGNSRCIYKKTSCNEEGQFVFSNGSFEEDTSCGCDFFKGYDFVTRPRNNCFCMPSKEDCSCYKLNCIRNDTNDHCTQDNYVFADTKCLEKELNMPQRTNIFGQIPDVKVPKVNDILGQYYTDDAGGPISTTVLLVLLITIVPLVCYCLRKEDTQDLKQADVVPPKNNEIYCDEMEKWKQKEQTFVVTTACEMVLDRIRTTPCVVVTGVGGCGKSSIIWHVAMTLEKTDGYVINIINDAAELESKYLPGTKAVYVLDDVWGKFSANKCLIEKWNSVLSIVKNVISNNSCKMLLACRLQVFQDTQLRDTIFKQYECNIISDELCLKKKEKKAIFQKYMNDELSQIDVLYGKIHLFPLLCELYSKETEQTQSKVHHYFTSPYAIYSEELANFRMHDKYKLCGLALCVIFNNKLKICDFEEMSKEFRKKIDSICQHLQLKIEESKYGKIKNALDTLVGTYVKENNIFYETIHDKLFDIIAFYFGQTMIECLIENGDSEFIRERFFLCKSENCHETEMEYIINIEEEFLPSYITRLISDWLNLKISDVFYNINMKNDHFRKELINILNTPLHTDEWKKKLANLREPYKEDYTSENTPLIISSLDGHIDIFEWLIHYDADVNYKRTDGVSALYMASQNGNFDIVKILLNKSANVNADTIEGVTPLGIACYSSGNAKIVHELLLNHADVNAYTYHSNNMTPLFMACLNNYVEIVEMLLQKKANPNICLLDGFSPLLLSCIKGQTYVVQLLLNSNADFNYEIPGGYTPLFFAASFGFPDVVNLLLKKGSDPTKRVAEKLEIAESLASSDSTACDNKGKSWSWFNHIKQKCSSKVMNYINIKPIDYTINVLAEATPLHAACFMGHSKTTNFLISENSNVDIQKSDGTTPLFYACELGHVSIAIALIEKGANPRICRVDKSSPIQIAKDNGHHNIVQFIERKK